MSYCNCGHNENDHISHCVPPFAVEGQQCHQRPAPLPCLGKHCVWLGCPCPSKPGRAAGSPESPQP